MNFVKCRERNERGKLFQCLRIFSIGAFFVDQVVVVALLFYVHGKHLRSCRDGQLT